MVHHPINHAVIPEGLGEGGGVEQVFNVRSTIAELILIRHAEGRGSLREWEIEGERKGERGRAVSYTHLTLPTIDDV